MASKLNPDYQIIKIKLDVDPRRDDDASPTSSVLKNEGSMVQTCRNINIRVVNTDILRPTTCLWIP